VALVRIDAELAAHAVLGQDSVDLLRFGGGSMTQLSNPRTPRPVSLFLPQCGLGREGADSTNSTAKGSCNPDVLCPRALPKGRTGAPLYSHRLEFALVDGGRYLVAKPLLPLPERLATTAASRPRGEQPLSLARPPIFLARATRTRRYGANQEFRPQNRRRSARSAFAWVGYYRGPSSGRSRVSVTASSTSASARTGLRVGDDLQKSC
jgi:hypothetical protein